MACKTPRCTGEHGAGTIRHTVLYQERSIVLHNVPADICPDCGDVVLTEETTIVIEDMLRTNAGSPETVFVYEA
jgi:YgiT-type zinc finger domain-containing protein